MPGILLDPLERRFHRRLRAFEDLPETPGTEHQCSCHPYENVIAATFREDVVDCGTQVCSASRNPVLAVIDKAIHQLSSPSTLPVNQCGSVHPGQRPPCQIPLNLP